MENILYYDTAEDICTETRMEFSFVVNISVEEGKYTQNNFGNQILNMLIIHVSE